MSQANNHALKPLVVLIVDVMERARFMMRLADAGRDSASFVFVTTEPLAALDLMLRGRRCFLIKRTATEPSSIKDIEGIVAQQSIEVLNQTIDPQIASVDYAVIVGWLHKFLDSRTVAKCIVWNGQQLFGLAVTQVARERGIPIAYLEISNLPSKIFVDTSGVNAASTLFENAQILDTLPDPGQAYHKQWLIQYENFKEKPLPQASRKVTARLVWLANEFCKGLIRGLCRFDSSKFTSSRSRIRTLLEENDCSISCLPNQFVFLPLQVSSDTQLKLNSNVDNVQALGSALQIAENRGLKLVVKIHPAETDYASVAKIIEEMRVRHFFISQSNTVNLIRSAQLVVTINSTVGLEALLYEKEVLILGRAIYKGFDQIRLRKYIHSFLVDDVDYFSNLPLSAEPVARLLGLNGKTG